MLCLFWILWWDLGAALPGKKVVFELGQVAMPPDTEWKSETSAQGIVYVGTRKKDPAATFIISVSNQGSSLMDSRAGAMETFVNNLSRSLAQSQQSQAQAVKFRMTDRGSKFSFRLSNGKEVYGEMLQGRTRTLVFAGVGATRSEMDWFTDSFETMEGQFVRPLSREESGNRAAAGYCWICGGVNLLVGPFLAILAAAMGYSFWVSLRNLWIAMCVAEFVGGTIYSYVMLENLGLAASIGVAIFAGLLVTGGIPIAAASLVVHKLKSRST